MVKIKDNAVKSIVSTEILLNEAVYRLVDVDFPSKVVVLIKKDYSLKGVRIIRDENQAITDIEVRLIMRYGHKLNEKGYEIVNSIRQTLMNMLGDLIPHNYMISMYIEGIFINTEV